MTLGNLVQLVDADDCVFGRTTISRVFGLVEGAGAFDGTPPAASAGFSTAQDYGTAKGAPVVIPVSDSGTAIVMVVVTVRFAGAAHAELIYVGTGALLGYAQGYTASSAITGNGVAGVGLTLTIRRDEGWPRGAAIFSVHAVDAAGNYLA